MTQSVPTKEELGFDPDKLRERYRLERDKRLRDDGNDQYIEMIGDSAYVPMAPRDNLNLLGKFTYRISPLMKVSLQMIHSGGKSKSYSHYYKYNPDGTSTSESSNNNISLKLNHALGKRSFYEANLSFSNTDYIFYQF